MKVRLVFVFVSFFIGFVVGWLGRSVRVQTVLTPADTVFIEIPTSVPIPTYYIHDTIIKTLPEYIYDTIYLTRFDTIKIVEAYLGKVFYSDTIGDSTFVAVIKDTISQNRIISRQFFHKDLDGNQIHYAYQTKWMVGLDAYFGEQWGFALAGGYQDKNRVYSVALAPNYWRAGIYFKF